MSGETEAIAIANMTAGLAQPSEGEAADAARIQRGIDATMRGVIADRYDPTRREPAPTVTVAGAMRMKDGGELNIIPRSGGWAEPRPIESPVPKGSFVEGVIGGMIDRTLGPAVPAAKPEAGGER